MRLEIWRVLERYNFHPSGEVLFTSGSEVEVEFTSGIEVEALTNGSVVFFPPRFEWTNRKATFGVIELVVMDTRWIVGTSTSGIEVEVE